MALAKQSFLSWQCDLHGIQQRLSYLFNTGTFTDITIKCHGGVIFEVHRMVLAMCSPVFEAMIFGPLSTSNDSLYLDDDPKVLQHVFAHCYGCVIQCDDIHGVLEIFKIADKYLFTDLKNECYLMMQKLFKPESFFTIYEFTVKYGYDDLRDSYIQFLQEDSNSIKATSVLMWFSLNSPKELLMPIFPIKKLIFDTWRNPKSEEPFDELVTILQSNCCNELKEVAGQMSADIIEYIPGPLTSSIPNIRGCCNYSSIPVLKISLQSHNAKEIIKALNARYKMYGREDIGIHISNSDIPAIFERGKWPKLPKLPCVRCDNKKDVCPGITLYFSDVTEENLDYIYEILTFLTPECNDYGYNEHQCTHSIMFPRSNFTKNDFSDFGVRLFRNDEFDLRPYCYYWINSPHIVTRCEEEINEIYRDSVVEAGMELKDFLPYIQISLSENDIPGW